MRDQSDLYYECHVTIDPVFDDQREQLAQIVKTWGFKLAELAMKKSKGDSWEESKKDTFFTAHSKSYSDLQQRMVNCIRTVQEAGFAVRRYKIEDTIIDSRNDDILGLIPNDA